MAEDRELLALQYSARPHAHLPPMLLAGAHYLLLSGVGRPLADVYADRSSTPAAPLFRELCLGNQSALLEVLNSRTVQTNEVGRSALLGPALTWAAAGEPLQLIDVGCSAGLNLFCDRYRLDYGEYGLTGPEDSTVKIECRVVAGAPPVAASLPTMAGRVGIDLDPPDLTDPDDARWLLACVWPGTGRFQRAARAIELGQSNPPPVLRGGALETLPRVWPICGGQEHRSQLVVVLLLLPRTAPAPISSSWPQWVGAGRWFGCAWTLLESSRHWPAGSCRHGRASRVTYSVR